MRASSNRVTPALFHITRPAPELRIHSLASGSSGNSMLVQSGDVSILIDAGIGIRRLSTHIAKRDVVDGSLAAVLLTHEHADHVVGAAGIARRAKAPIVANARTLAAYCAHGDLPFETRELPTGDEIAFGPISVRSFPVPHDAVEPVGFVITAGSSRIAYFTDVGSITKPVRDALRHVNLAVVESNHDLEWLRRGPYTAEMKARVASSHGHLSNHECAALLAERLELDGPMSVWLAHLSRVNNSPSLARRTIIEQVTRLTKTSFHLEIALRDQPSVSWTAGERSVQLRLLGSD